MDKTTFQQMRWTIRVMVLVIILLALAGGYYATVVEKMCKLSMTAISEGVL